MNFPHDYFGHPQAPAPYGYYCPMYDPYAPPYWRYPPNPYQAPMPYPYYGMNETELREQNKSVLEPGQEFIKKEADPKEQIEEPSNKEPEEFQSMKQVSIKKQCYEEQGLNHCFVNNKLKIQENGQKIVLKSVEIRQNLICLFTFFQGDYKRYNTIFADLASRSPLHKEIYSIIDHKIKTFKKSKEEMIKIIIRRTQRYYKTTNKCRKDPRFIKYGGFKSMNTVYLKTIFSDTLFLQAFEVVAVNFKEQFIRENQLKMESIAMEMSKIQSCEQLQSIMKVISQKNKMPWPQVWMLKMFRTIIELYETFGQRKSDLCSSFEK